ncbi:MAG: hypothetical protein ACI8W7_000340 [Gammaproteobacteria bacterium]|jgi:hypothetical protein
MTAMGAKAARCGASSTGSNVYPSKCHDGYYEAAPQLRGSRIRRTALILQFHRSRLNAQFQISNTSA